MVKKCEYKGCKKATTRADPKTLKAMFCTEHSPKDFVIINRNKKCEKCNKVRASFGLQGGKPIYCKKCIPKNNNTKYINVRGKKCKKCEKYACFGKLGTKKREYCKTHAPDDYINVVSKKCQYIEGCANEAKYSEKTGDKPIYCPEHAPENYVTSRPNRLCKFNGCTISASFGLQKSKPEYCKKHRPSDEYINCKTPVCKFEGCAFFAMYGKTGKKEWCTKHAPEGCTNYSYKRCKFLGCDKYPSFGLKNGIEEYCKKHRPSDEYVNVKTPICKYPNCKISANYSKKGTTVKEYCKTHCPEGYEHVGRKCLHEGCTTVPKFAKKGSEKGEYCKRHKPSNEYIDVVTRSCSHENCNKKRIYGYPGNTPEYCGEHKQPGTKTNPKTKCIVCKKNIALYGYTNATHCEEHKVSDHIDLVQKNCKSCNLPDILNKDGLCDVCNPEAFNRARLAKQKTVKNYFDHVGLKYIGYDQQIDHGDCGKERPDFLFDCNTHFIVLEVDEHQHEDRNCLCEQTRMINIGESLGLKTIFIRWNPDKYKPINGRRQEKLQTRLEMLQHVIEKLSKISFTDGVIYCSYMFFDNDEPEKWLEPIKLR